MQRLSCLLTGAFDPDTLAPFLSLLRPHAFSIWNRVHVLAVGLPWTRCAHFDIVTSWCFLSFQSEFVTSTCLLQAASFTWEYLGVRKGEGAPLLEPRKPGNSLLTSHCSCLFILPALPLHQLSAVKRLCAGEGTNGTKVLLAICQNNSLPFPTWCAQMDGWTARGTVQGPPLGQTRIYEVTSLSSFSASFVGEGRKAKLSVPFSDSPNRWSQQGVTMASQQYRHPGLKVLAQNGFKRCKQPLFLHLVANVGIFSAGTVGGWK